MSSPVAVSSPVANLALLLMFPAAMLAFATLKPIRAVLWIALGSALFLPDLVIFDFPGIPGFDKYSIPNLCLLIGVLVLARRKVKEARFGHGIDLLVVLMFLAAIGTALTNKDTLTFGPTTLEALSLSSGVSRCYDLLLGVLSLGLFLVARVMFRSAADAKELLKALVIACLIYAPFMVIELLMSPQWNVWIYGFHQHSFAQSVREGGYRPMVFMAHGLALALFTCGSALAGWALVKGRTKIFGVSALPAAALLSALLVALNSLGALVYLILLLPCAWFLSPKTQLRVAMVLAGAVFFYPLLRGTEYFPRQSILDLAAQVSQDRAGSLAFRFNNEDILIERAFERPWFGWGQSLRSHVFSPDNGADISVTDGAWIAILGQCGIVGYCAYYGLLLLPVVMARRRIDRVSPSDQPLLSGLALVLVLYAVDQIPNGAFNGFGMLFAGAVAGLAQGMSTEASRTRPEVRAFLLRILSRRLAQRAEALRFRA